MQQQDTHVGSALEKAYQFLGLSFTIPTNSKSCHTGPLSDTSRQHTASYELRSELLLRFYPSTVLSRLAKYDTKGATFC